MEEYNEKQILAAEYSDLAHAQTALQILGRQGFTLDHLSIVSRSDDETLRRLKEDTMRMEEGSDSASRGAAIGAMLGGALGAPLAIATLIGPFFLLGPIVTMGGGAALGAWVGAANHWGMPDEKIEQYQRDLESGRALVIVQPGQKVNDTKAIIRSTEPLSLDRFDFHEGNIG